MSDKLKVLFLCTGNSCRSQMAEGWARHLKGDQIEAYSAGVEPHGMNVMAVKVMAEAGVDISRQSSKHVNTLANVRFDDVVTVCGHANESCPIFPGKTKVIHVGFDDPPALAKEARTETEALEHYRRVRDEIRDWIQTLPDALQRTTHAAPRDRSKPGVLVLCVGNSARSQMAEGFLKKYVGDLVDVHSAGMEPKVDIDPLAVRAMSEAGIDIRKQWPKSTRAYLGRARFQFAVIVCHQTEKNCPRIFIGATNRLHWPIDDPTAATGTYEEQMGRYKSARDQIEAHVKTWAEVLRQTVSL